MQESTVQWKLEIHSSEAGGNGAEAPVCWKKTHVCDHLAPGLVPLPVVGPLLFLLQHALSRRAILQGKLAQDLAEAMDADLAHRVHWMAQEQQERVEPAGAHGTLLNSPLNTS